MHGHRGFSLIAAGMHVDHRRAAAHASQDCEPEARTRAPGRKRTDDGRRSGPATPRYVIGPDDVLQIVFWREKDLSGEVVVRSDGRISLPLLNDVVAAGRTPEELRTALIAGRQPVPRRSERDGRGQGKPQPEGVHHRERGTTRAVRADRPNDRHPAHRHGRRAQGIRRPEEHRRHAREQRTADQLVRSTIAASCGDRTSSRTSILRPATPSWCRRRLSSQRRLRNRVVPVHVLAAILTILLLWSPAADLHAQAPERRPSSAVFGAPDPRQSPRRARMAVCRPAGRSLAPTTTTLLSGQGSAHAPPAGSSARAAPIRIRAVGFSTIAWATSCRLRASVASTGRYYPAFERFVLGRQFADVSSSSDRVAVAERPREHRRDGRYSQIRRAVHRGDVVRPTASPSSCSTETTRSDLRRTDDASRPCSARAGLGPAQVDRASWPESSLRALEGSERAEGYDLGGTFSTRIARYGTFRAGYTRQEIDRGVRRAIWSTTSNLGGDYGRPLSASRRAFVSFSGGSAALESSGLGSRLGDCRRQTQVRVRAIVDRPRSLSPRDHVRRRDRRPVVVRRRERRARTACSPGGSIGCDSGPSRAASSDCRARRAPYDVYGAHSRGSGYALSRVAAVYAEYLLLSLSLRRRPSRLGGSLPSYFDRQTVRVGVTVMTQLLR